MSETSTLISCTGKISRAELAQVPTPPSTATHVPIPHAAVVEGLVDKSIHCVIARFSILDAMQVEVHIHPVGEPRRLDGVIDGPAALDPIRRRDTYKEGQPLTADLESFRSDQKFGPETRRASSCGEFRLSRLRQAALSSRCWRG